MWASKPLAVTGAPAANFADVPTMIEAGYAGIGTSNWQGLFASRHTAADIVQVLHQAAVKAMNSPEAKAAFEKVNAAVTTSETPDKFAAEIKNEMATWQQLRPEVLALPAENRETYRRMKGHDATGQYSQDDEEATINNHEGGWI